MADEGGEMLHGGGSGVAEPSAQRGGIANLRRPSSTDEAREWGRRGGIASGQSRRRKASLRDELVALLTAHDGTVAKAIAVAICKEAKNGNVGAFRAIAQVLGELKEVIGIEGDSLPPPIVLSVHDAGFIEAERERQKREFAEVVDAAYTELMPQGAEADSAETPETSGLTGKPSVGGAGDGAGVAPTEGSSGAESRETGTGAAEDAPGGAEASAQGDGENAPTGAEIAPVEDGGGKGLQNVTDSPQPPHPPQPRAPRTPSEAAAMRRAEAERQRLAQGGNAQGGAGGRPKPRFFAVPSAFPRR